MAKTFGILSAASTGFTAVGTLSNFTRTNTAEVGYGYDANGEPDSDDGGVRGPETISATLEVDGTLPAQKDTITIGTDVYIITNITETWQIGSAYGAEIEATEQQTA